MNRGGGYSYSDLYLLGEMEQYFVDIQIELGKVSDGINYSSCRTIIDRINTDKTSLECYINCLPSDIDEKIDQPFTMKVSDIMDYLCTIDATKIKTDNIIDLKKNVSYTGISYEKEKLDYLTLEHFVGSSHKTKDAISHCNYDKFTHDDYVDEYTKIFKDTYASEYKKYLDDKGNFSEQDFLDSLVIEESYYKKKSGYVEELLESLGQLTIILPVVEGVLNREVFTEDRTTDDEAAGKISNAMIQLFTLGEGVIASKGIGALRTVAVSVAGDVTATTISVTGERLKLPRGLTMAMAFIAANGVQNGMIKTFKTPGGRTIEIGKAESVADASKAGKYSVEIKGGTYENLDAILKKYDLSEAEYLNLSRTPQHKLNPEYRELVYKIRMELTSDVTDASGVVRPGTRVSKSIDKDTFEKFYTQDDEARLSGCVALQRDTDALVNDLDIINSTGLKFEGSNFVDKKGNPNVFYIVDGELMKSQPDLVVRVSATADGIEISDKVAQQFNKKYPDYKYNGYSITDVSSSNDTYLNEIWTRQSHSQVKELSGLTGISEENIVTEPAQWYNRTTNPDTGTGITLNQGSSNAMGIPEFYAGKGRVGIANGHIYKVEGDIRTLVGTIDEDGFIYLIGK